MNAREVLEAYNRVLDRQQGGRGGEHLSHMEIGSIAITTDRISDHKHVLRLINEFEPAEGWIGFQSKNSLFKDGKLSEPDEAFGLPLSAECFNPDRGSLHVRQDGAGSWIVARYRPADGDDCLFDNVSFIATDAAIGRLRYLRYWRIDTKNGVEPFAVCFVGFGEE